MSYAPECFLAGAMNTRDLGGIRAAGGRTVAKQKLIRSGELSKVTDDDIAKLTHIRLKTIVDLRSPAETSLKMDIIPDGVRYVHCPVVSDLVPGITRESIEDPYDGLKRTDYARDLREGGMAKMRSLYPILVENSNAVKQYRRFFDCVLENDGDGAILFHCAMGKRQGRGSRGAAAVRIGRVDERYHGRLHVHRYLLRRKKFGAIPMHVAL